MHVHTPPRPRVVGGGRGSRRTWHTSDLGHHTHGKLCPRHIGHRSPHKRETLAKAHRPLVTKHTGSFGQDTSAIGHQADGKLRRARHDHGTPRLGTPRPWHTSARTIRPWHTSARTIRPWHTSDVAHLDRGTPRRARPPPTTRGRGGVCTRTLARCVVTPPLQLEAETGCARAPWPGVP